ncbi:hypothetical protein CKM354_000645900 [Cercospora kikuchii]|uniref:Uncharacterized protein n=1 Tax=Cercospora kikuchii TaxID=84275 RepID=A0A9P3CI72_9PEZI|nr:uncharacterized protein CKM354_000645900 [Cercospora kikuchii]GIZ43226.1 hypothetical protein CKM354_000645900 [Cercospora kikuchii]
MTPKAETYELEITKLKGTITLKGNTFRTTEAGPLMEKHIHVSVLRNLYILSDKDSPALLVGKHVPIEKGKREVAIYKALEKMKDPTTYRTVLQDSMELHGDNKGTMILFVHPRGVGTLESDVVQTMTKEERKVLMHQTTLKWGTAAYHPPEMGAVCGWYNGRQADVFAIGVSCHCL